MKAGSRWRDEFSRTLIEMHTAGVISDSIGVYLGSDPLQHGPVRILPPKHFQRALAQGEILPSTPSKSS